MKQNKQAFTLIELLVVILIIGILAAVALPQYKKAVVKSRNTQLKTLIASVVTAQQAYVLSNGECAIDFSELDIDLPLGKSSADPCALYHTGTDAIRATDDYYIALNGNRTWCSVSAAWKTGDYACAGFTRDILLDRENVSGFKKFLCVEKRNNSWNLQGKFCQQLEQGTSIGVEGGWERYLLP